MALEAETIIEAGAFSGAVLTMSAVFLGSVYQWPSFEVTRLRGADPQAEHRRVPRARWRRRRVFAIDSHMDADRARRSGSIRPSSSCATCLKDGDLMAHGAALAGQRRPRVPRRARSSIRSGRRATQWKASGGKNGARLRGTGLAVGGWVRGIQPTGATVRLNPDGTLAVLTGAVDIAGTNMGLALIAATAYGVDIDQVRIITGDTDTAPLTGHQRGQQDDLHGRARRCCEAAEDARRQTLEIAAARARGVGPTTSTSSDDQRGGARRAGQVDHAAPDRQEGQPLRSKMPPVLGKRAPAVHRCRRRPSRPSLPGSRWTRTPAQITLHDFVVVQDVGKAINPLGVEGQMQGGAVQSLGFALTEGLMYDDDGRLTQPEPARLPQAHRGRPAEHRDDHRRGARAGRPVRRPRRRRAADHPGARRDRQRRAGRHRRAPDRAAADARADRPGDPGAAAGGDASLKLGLSRPQSVPG